MPRKSRIAWVVALAAWALAGGPGCGWTWSAQPQVIITEDDCDGALSLALWNHEEAPNPVLARELRAADCVPLTHALRARWHDLYLWCERAPLTDSTSGLIVPVFGARGDRLRDACQRIVVAEEP